MKKKLQYLLITMLVFLLFSCSGGTEQGSTGTTENEVLSSITNNVIMPELNTLSEVISSFNTVVVAFVNTPNVTNLENAQEAWKDAQAAWQKTISFQFGPADENLLLSKINYYPNRPDTIETYLSSETEITTENISVIGATKRGLPVIEYLLFSETLSNTELVTSFTESERKTLYLKLLSNQIKTDINTIVDAWNEDNGNYKSTFVNSSTGMNSLINEIVSTIEVLKGTRVGKPLGKSNGGEIQPSEVESPLSKNSLSNIKNTLIGMKNLYKSEFNSVNNYGLDDYVISRGYATLNDDIETQFDTVLTQVDAISNPLQTAVSSEFSAVETLYDELTTLLRYLKVDVANAINETIHFNDSDGD